MRTLMLIASIAMIGSGIFCVANGSAAFFTIAFLVGLLFCAMGILEIFVGIRADFDIKENALSILKYGVLMLLFGIVIMSGQITDDTTALMLFALWLTIEGVVAFSSNMLDVVNITGEQRLEASINVFILVFGMYMFFNMALFNFKTTLLIGAALVILGLKRFITSFKIEYIRPSFVTGNEEKLREALEEEKRALAKAKEGIREQKNAQRRIDKIREDMAAEQDVKNAAEIRRLERKMEDEANE